MEGIGLVQLAMGELSSALRGAVGASSVIEHRLLKGEFRERRVIAGLRPFIPRQYDMYSGVVVNSEGRHSRQQDIILSDAVAVPPFLAAGELGVHMVETVSAVIEVKSVATVQAMREAVENVASVKQLMSDEPREQFGIRAGRFKFGKNVDKPFGGVIFLGSGAVDRTLFDTFADAAEAVAPNDRPNAVVVVDDFALTWGSYIGTEEARKLTGQSEPLFGSHLIMQKLGNNSLLAFYMVLMAILTSYEPPPLDVFTYIKNSGGFGEYNILTREVTDG